MTVFDSANAARSATRLITGLLAALALLPPLGVLGAGWWVERRGAELQAAIVHGALAQGAVEADEALLRTVAAGSLPDAATRRRVAAAQAALVAPMTSLAQGRIDGRVALRDAQSRVQRQVGSRPPWPRLEMTAVLAVPRGDIAAVEVARPLRPVLLAGTLAALGSSSLALVLWWLVLRRPVARLRKAEGRIRQHARLDGLTGVLNREGLNLRIAQALQRPAPRGTTTGVLVLDLDRFNLVNGSLGQAGGDRMLRSVADRLRGVVRGNDALARIGGDQFVVVIEQISSPQVLETMARNVLRAFEPPFVVEGRDLQLSFSAGGVLASDEACTADDLLRQASAAMRAAKAAGGGRFNLFEPAMDDHVEERLDLDLRLRRALNSGQFFLLYQPIVEPHQRRVVAVEALLRWAAPERGFVSPGEFIPVLEETGLIVSVGHWVLHEGCKRAAGWLREGHKDLVLSVNISPRQIAEADFVERVRGTLLTTGLPASYLQLEVTEGLLLEPTPETLKCITGLAALGVRLAVDDFGMGYSSLAYLKSFPLHGLKIDRMFLREITEREQDLAIVRAIVDLGHGLGLEVTAEGVETEAQCELLRKIGCDALQGFLFSRPTAADALSLADAVRALPPAPISRPGDLAAA